MGTRLTLGIFNTGTGPEKTGGIVHIHGLNVSGKDAESVSTDMEIEFQNDFYQALPDSFTVSTCTFTYKNAPFRSIQQVTDVKTYSNPFAAYIYVART